MLANLVLLCLLSCVSGWIMIDKLSPSKPVEGSYNTQVNNDTPISALNYAIIEHVKDMLGDISNNLDLKDTSGKKGQDDTKIYCFGDVLDRYSICRERCQRFNSTYQSIQCTAQDLVSYLTSCVTGTMECYAKDINDCLDNNGGCDQTCQNTDGSFSCSCLPGYVLGDDGKSCTDINECLDNNGGCDQTCQNTDGSFSCSCLPGYVLGDDGKSCTGCNPGFTISDDAKSCNGCPSGMFKHPNSNRCFKLTDYGMSWDSGLSSCASEGLVIARPADDIAVALRQYLLDTYGGQYIWIGGRGDGSNQSWELDGSAVSLDLLWPGAESEVSPDRCLAIYAFEHGVTSNPNRLYTTSYCTDIRRVLCEVELS